MSLEVLKRELKEGKGRGLYLFYGPETYLVRHYAAELEKLVVEEFARQISYQEFGERPDPGAVYDACMAAPLFGERRMVVVRRAGLLKPAAGAGGGKKKPPAKKSTAASGASGPSRGSGAARRGAANVTFEALIEDLPPSTCLLIIEDEVDKRLKLFGQIGRGGLVVEFPYQPPHELEKWVAAIAARDGKRFTRGALRLFMEGAGESMTEIRSGLDKLLLYAAEKTGIDEDDVAAVCPAPLKTRIFDLMDAVSAGKRLAALSLLDDLLAMREPVQLVMSLLSDHLVKLSLIKRLAMQGMRPKEAAALTGLHPYRTEKLWQQGARLDPEQLARAVEACYDRDLAIKSGRMDETLALELLIASIL
ncbi:MAG: DNA polymerase III subunit delta [Clostridiales bacterium]|nr:DNA polymerase III subunit delta [Clostridiales bacterium]